MNEEETRKTMLKLKMFFGVGQTHMRMQATKFEIETD